ncbi:hypothetical protein Ancab_008892 [Ancistrocladus abbreviatus]
MSTLLSAPYPLSVLHRPHIPLFLASFSQAAAFPLHSLPPPPPPVFSASATELLVSPILPLKQIGVAVLFLSFISTVFLCFERTLAAASLQRVVCWCSSSSTCRCFLYSYILHEVWEAASKAVQDQEAVKQKLCDNLNELDGNPAVPLMTGTSPVSSTTEIPLNQKNGGDVPAINIHRQQAAVMEKEEERRKSYYMSEEKELGLCPKGEGPLHLVGLVLDLRWMVGVESTR